MKNSPPKLTRILVILSYVFVFHLSTVPSADPLQSLKKYSLISVDLNLITNSFSYSFFYRLSARIFQ
jgi:hypothetical protein